MHNCQNKVSIITSSQLHLDRHQKTKVTCFLAFAKAQVLICEVLVKMLQARKNASFSRLLWYDMKSLLETCESHDDHSFLMRIQQTKCFIFQVSWQLLLVDPHWFEVWSCTGLDDEELWTRLFRPRNMSRHPSRQSVKSTVTLFSQATSITTCTWAVLVQQVAQSEQKSTKILVFKSMSIAWETQCSTFARDRVCAEPSTTAEKSTIVSEIWCLDMASCLPRVLSSKVAPPARICWQPSLASGHSASLPCNYVLIPFS